MKEGYDSRNGSGSSKRGLSLVHELVERPFREPRPVDDVLELGLGRGQRAPLVKHDFQEILIAEPRSGHTCLADSDDCVCGRIHGSGKSFRLADDWVRATPLVARLAGPISVFVKRRRV